MDHALALAARGLGRVWPNPAVGCVIERNGVILGRGGAPAGGGAPGGEGGRGQPPAPGRGAPGPRGRGA
ncbi:MAG: hypothetical protein AAGE03_17660, partial [Pseudomonadota bacterium]